MHLSSKKRKYSELGSESESKQSSKEEIRILEKRIHQLQKEIAEYKERLEQPKNDYSSNYIS